VPPRFAYWTILAGGLPTAFRAADREELLPTFQRLREKHPDAEMKWFARGKLWNSPEEARHAFDREASRPRARVDGDRSRFRGPSGPRNGAESGGREGERRGRDWRPGGEHRDPRQKFADAKKARNLEQRKQRFERKHRADADRPRERTGNPSARHEDGGRTPPPHGDRRFSPEPRGSKGGWRDRPRQSDRETRGGFGPRQDQRKPDWRDRPRDSGGATFRPRGEDAPRENRDTRKPDWRDKPRGEGGFRARDSAKPDWRDKPRDASGGRPRDAGKPDWRNKPGGAGGFRARDSAKPDWRGKPRDASGGRPRDAGTRDWRDRPPQSDGPKNRDAFGSRPGGSDREWRNKPGGDRRRFNERPGVSGDRNRHPEPRGDAAPRGAASVGKRPFERPGFERSHREGTEEPRPPKRPRSPSREPRPSENPAPTPPPRPSEPSIAPPGPPERGSTKRPRRWP
jgi:hypothetical protein